MIEVAFDCSAFSELAHDEGRKEDFLSYIASREVRLVLPQVAFIELLASHTAAPAGQRHDLVREFAASDECEFIIGANENEIIRREQAEAFEGTPETDDPDIVEIATTTDIRARHATLSPSLDRYLAKSISESVDRAVRGDFPSDFPGATSKYLEHLLGDPRADLLRDGNTHLQQFAPDAATRTRVREAPASYPCTVMATAYLSLVIYGAAFADVGYGKYAGLLLAPTRRRRGSWVDGRTAAASVYADVFLTCDNNQRTRVNWIAEQFGLALRTHDLAEWLG